MEQLNMLFDEAEAQLPIVEAAETAFVAGYTRKKRTGGVEEILPDNVPVEAVEHRPDAAALNCPECGTLMTEIGKEVRRPLVITPAQAKIREDWFYAYVCEKCKRKGTETPVLKTEKTPSVIPGSYASPEAIAHIMVKSMWWGLRYLVWILSNAPARALRDEERAKKLTPAFTPIFCRNLQPKNSTI